MLSSTLHFTQGQPELSQAVLNVMLDLCENFTGGERGDGDDNECYVKLADDQWVIGKCSDKRQGIYYQGLTILVGTLGILDFCIFDADATG